VADEDPRGFLLSTYQQVVEQLSGRRCVARFLEAHPQTTPFHVLAVGKAAGPMALACADVCGERLQSALVVQPPGPAHDALDERFALVHGEHPLPGPGSFEAGARVLTFLDQLPDGEPLLVLLSGGGSSLMESARSGVSESDLLAIHEWLLSSGLDIVDINRVRQGLSRVKGGALARRVGERPCQVLCLSDVPPGQMSALASGPFLPPLPGPLPGLPDWISVLMGDTPAESTPDVAHHMLADSATLRTLAGQRCESWGLPVEVVDQWVEGDAADVGRQLAEAVIEGQPGFHVWSGETTVTLPAISGQGGRCQQLALAAAERFHQSGEPCFLLACGSDGLDGPEGDAGALVDSETLSRGAQGELSAEDALDWADSGRFLDAAGDLVYSGPSETNVNDLIVALKLPKS